MVLGVEDLAEEQAGNAEDRGAQVRAAHAQRARRWEALLDDESMGLMDVGGEDRGVQGLQPELPSGVRKAEYEEQEGHVRRAVIRHVFLLIDMTDAARQPDYKPRRFEFATAAAQRFVRRFFADHPLAQLGLAILRGGTCEAVAPLGTREAELCSRLQAAAAEGPRGRMSLGNGLRRVAQGLETAPPYGTKEALLLCASLSTCDPVESLLQEAVSSLKTGTIRLSVVSMSPEFHVLQQACKVTGGNYGVALDPHHYEELLDEHLSAPPCLDGGAKLVKMGFPQVTNLVAASAMCACHSQVRTRLYVCPQCKTRACEVPSRCSSCELPLASAPLIARTFRHLLPVPEFKRSKLEVLGPVCCACGAGGEAMRTNFRCPRCAGLVCGACDDFIHSTLRQCPGCLGVPGPPTR